VEPIGRDVNRNGVPRVILLIPRADSADGDNPGRAGGRAQARIPVGRNAGSREAVARREECGAPVAQRERGRVAILAPTPDIGHAVNRLITRVGARDRSRVSVGAGDEVDPWLLGGPFDARVPKSLNYNDQRIRV
jgi:hypothetical protein